MLEYISKGCYNFVYEGTLYGIYWFKEEWQVWYESSAGDTSFFLGSQSNLTKVLEMIKGC